MSPRRQKLCTIEGCAGKRHARGLCNKHYLRQWAHGTTDDPRHTPLERILTKRQITPSGCWLWTGARNDSGYGRVGIGGSRTGAVHRVAYELLIGPVPAALDLDHLCRVRHCFNPKHLEPVTRSENLRRGVGVGGRRVKRATS